MIHIGFFSEMHTFCDNGSIRDHIVSSISYDREQMIQYLSSFRKMASCPRNAIDCVTGETIAPSFSIYNDGEFCWGDFLIYHVQKYNLALPQELVKKVMNTIETPLEGICTVRRSEP